jgi:hypothetical protein
MSNEETDWARESFGAARLGDPRRVARLVAMAEQAATTPAGRVTEVFKSSATREGAFRLLESTAVPSERVAEALFEATGRRIEGGELVYVAIDGSSLTLSDRSKRRELGRVGKRWPTRGLHVMTALALDNGGTAMGVLDQQWWAQPETPKRDRRKCFGTKYLEKADFGEARAVVRGYTLRWRIEEFHRAWKRGLCRVEDTQLQSRGAIIKWASILAGVAARALRVAQLLRTKPDVPASQEFTEYEIAATFALAKKKLDRRRKLSFKEVAAMIADIGGFANKYSGHPDPRMKNKARSIGYVT